MTDSESKLEKQANCPHIIEANLDYCILCGKPTDNVDRSLLESRIRMGEYGIDPREAEDQP